ncbi:hypothetical protein EJ05DRAFT_513004 [Pseudovirgaria hyperparasitica]|uniref:Uncharacterized protein n=1 Tax=Pseudovirgaria hyperparasitica TaxID=470096 RepID=A0A6A6W1Q3_9PEZI|nr:uncharacterized protein EJ05DRAFT_513004 [Pseudovirgaria hyperparasitica]KAF2755497.1 hypothetical protein EJ05DRAFT_513004 [Pseudovirgaria hyperparasitica]
MTAFGSFLKAILAPALIALVAYILLSYFVLPFIRRHRQRYNQYLPVNGGLSTISNTALTVRQRVGDALITFFLPSYGLRRVIDGSRDPRGSEDVMFDDEEGEDMVGFDIDERRREALERRRSNVGEEDLRLSRDLEEGFKDDSDDETTGSRTER